MQRSVCLSEVSCSFDAIVPESNEVAQARSLGRSREQTRLPRLEQR